MKTRTGPLFKFRERRTPLPQRLHLGNIYILPTRHGMLFLVILAGMLVGSVNYGNNFGFLLTFLLGGITLAALFHTHANLAGLSILAVKSVPVFAGEYLRFDFHVRVGRRPRFAVAFAVRGGETVLRDLAPERDIQVETGVPAIRRGLQPFPGLVVATTFPLGLFKAWSKLRPPADGVVYPRPLAATFKPTARTNDSRDPGTRFNPGVDDFNGLKPYQPGDPLQRISWKAFSKGQGLMVKDFVGPMGTSVLIAWNDIQESDRERKLSLICDLVLKACRRNLAFGLQVPGTNIAADRGEAHKHRCLRTLALFPGGHSAP